MIHNTTCTRTHRSNAAPRQLRRSCGSLIVLLALFVSATLTSAAQAGFPLTCKSNTVYDGKGQTIDARSLSRVFNVWSVKNVTVKNYTVIGSVKTRVFDISYSSGIKLENITIKTFAADVVHIHSSADISVTKVVADTIDRYLVWVDYSDRVKIVGCVLTTGSKSESGIRVMDWSSNVILDGCNIKAKLNKQTALRLHDGSNFTVRNSSFEGHVWPGPMGGTEGGEKENNTTLRRALLAKRTTNVLFENVNILGSLGPQAGLSGFVMTGGSITAKSGTPFFNSPFNNTTWCYPEVQYYRSGDVKRSEASGVMKNVKIIAPGRTTLNFGSNGPFDLSGCTLNGKPVIG